MTIFDNYEVWFVIGSQHLYGAETLRQVTQHAEHVVNALNTEAKLPCKLVLKPLGTSPDEITAICRDANYDDRCAGLVVWLHTFSPAKMWINGLSILNKPLLQFHTQFNAALPWDSIDMDFMNLNQTAHGGREFGFIGARMRQQHAVVTGHWQDKEAHTRIGAWMRQAVSKQDTRQLKVCRFGDNMREVAVTDGDKVAAQIKFGFSVNTWAVGDLVQVVNSIGDGDINALIDEYESSYTLTPATQIHGDKRQNVREAARHYESDVNRSAGRHLIYGGLHLPLRERQRSGARLAHAGSVSVHRGGRETDPRRPAPRHWRSADRLRSVDSGWRRAPYRLQPRAGSERYAPVCRNTRYRNRGD